jgi:hypothetical protein
MPSPKAFIGQKECLLSSGLRLAENTPVLTPQEFLSLHFSTPPSGDAMYPDVDATAFEEHAEQICPSEQDPPAEGYSRDCFVLRYLLFKRA